MMLCQSCPPTFVQVKTASNARSCQVCACICGCNYLAKQHSIHDGVFVCLAQRHQSWTMQRGTRAEATGASGYELQAFVEERSQSGRCFGGNRLYCCQVRHHTTTHVDLCEGQCPPRIRQAANDPGLHLTLCFQSVQMAGFRGPSNWIHWPDEPHPCLWDGGVRCGEPLAPFSSSEDRAVSWHSVSTFFVLPIVLCLVVSWELRSIENLRACCPSPKMGLKAVSRVFPNGFCFMDFTRIEKTSCSLSPCFFQMILWIEHGWDFSPFFFPVICKELRPLHTPWWVFQTHKWIGPGKEWNVTRPLSRRTCRGCRLTAQKMRWCSSTFTPISAFDALMQLLFYLKQTGACGHRPG